MIANNEVEKKLEQLIETMPIDKEMYHRAVSYFLEVALNRCFSNISAYSEGIDGHENIQELFALTLFSFQQASRIQWKEVNLALTPREEKIIRMRFGLDGNEPATLEETGKVFQVTRARIRQIEGKALRKLRHPSRRKLIKDYLPDEWGV